tara:strand:+ start:178 stop:834 length:657 start_codon:yes stop_codon:yes gene_type:complete
MEELQATSLIDADHPDVIAYANAHYRAADSVRDNAVRLYYAVRDDFRYDPYTLELTITGLRASRVLETQRGWCVTKANLLAACCRAVGIPARLGYADVRNHLSTARMREHMGTDLFVWHGYTDILIDDAWVKATPAFNVELCEKFRLHPLEFDGTEDSIYHPFDLDGRQHMEYVRFHGTYNDVPLAAIVDGMREAYPNMLEAAFTGNFDAEVAAETGS